MIKALTWWVGRIKVFDAAIATSNAAILGSALHWTAMFMARGIMSTVAPTFDVTRVKKDVKKPMSTNTIRGVKAPCMMLVMDMDK